MYLRSYTYVLATYNSSIFIHAYTTQRQYNERSNEDSYPVTLGTSQLRNFYSPKNFHHLPLIVA